MTLRDALLYGRAVLGNSSEPRILLAATLEKSMEFCLAHPEWIMPEADTKKYKGVLKKRLHRWPIAYLIGHKEFFGLDFLVTPAVLIPRPETELLLENALLLAKDFKTPKILDVGTGSGCIAIALAKNLPQARITAADISASALAVARKNARKHRVKIRFVQGDLLAPFLKEKFNIVVANLPYVPRKEAHLVEEQVKKHEPDIALWAGRDGMRYMKKFLLQIAKMQHPPHTVICEFGFSMKKNVARILKKINPDAKITFLKDYSGRDRMFICMKN